MMEDHILDKHIGPDADNIYRCKDCIFESNCRENFSKHFRAKHSSRNATISSHSTARLKVVEAELDSKLKELAKVNAELSELKLTTNESSMDGAKYEPSTKPMDELSK